MTEWRTIDSAPRDGTILILWCATPIERLYASPKTAENVCVGFYGDSGGMFRGVDWYSVESREEIWGYGGEFTGPMSETECLACVPTHWMPLPAPPTEERA